MKLEHSDLKLRAFHGSTEIKDHFISKLSDSIASGKLYSSLYYGVRSEIRTSGRNRKASRSIAATLVGKDDDTAYEKELGIPIILGYFQELYFQELKDQYWKDWPVTFLTAIQPGADLSTAWPRLANWLLSDHSYGLGQYVAGTPVHKYVVQSVIRIFNEGEQLGQKLAVILSELEGIIRIERKSQLEKSGSWDDAIDPSLLSAEAAVMCLKAQMGESHMAALAFMNAATVHAEVLSESKPSDYFPFKRQVYFTQSQQLVEILKTTQ